MLIGLLIAQACDDLLLRRSRNTRLTSKLRQAAAPFKGSKLHLAKTRRRVRVVLAHLSKWGVIRCDETSHHTDDFLFSRVQRSIRRLGGHRGARSPVGGGRSLRRHLVETVSKAWEAVKLMPVRGQPGAKAIIQTTYKTAASGPTPRPAATHTRHAQPYCAARLTRPKRTEIRLYCPPRSQSLDAAPRRVQCGPSRDRTRHAPRAHVPEMGLSPR